MGRGPGVGRTARPAAPAVAVAVAAAAVAVAVAAAASANMADKCRKYCNGKGGGISGNKNSGRSQNISTINSAMLQCLKIIVLPVIAIEFMIIAESIAPPQWKMPP